MRTDTIAAIATGIGSSGISIIRVSGQEAISVVNELFFTKSNKQILLIVESHTIHYGFIKMDGSIIDEVMVSIMKAPRSYTMEDVVEINCHGGILVTRKILDLVLSKGARLAEPGEFTKRAFLNGRIDLSSAEAVMDLIEAKNEFALKSSENQLQGKIKKAIEQLRERILYEIAFIESAIDDPEHISLDGYNEKLLDITNEIYDKILHLLKNAENGRILKDGIQTVIIGRPNAGKSSFLNAIMGVERAIVTDIAGTTRDILEESVLVNDIMLHVIDTAGIHEADDLVEKIGIEKAKEAALSADLILYIVDGSVPLTKEEDDILSLLLHKKMIVLLNKSDLESVVTKEDVQKKLVGLIPSFKCSEINHDNVDVSYLEEKIINIPILEISSKENKGIDEFGNLIEEMFLTGKISLEEEIYITNLRHKEALMEARESLKMVKQSIIDEMPEDFYSIDLMNAYTSLGKIIGQELGDDLAQEIFSKFCMGK